ncbi:MAG TPA: hypothetical protein VFT22_30980 [Kofleriaceae bacterium]|nr:hypothetical protein [Kofleriaceae bacterium]
MCDQVAERVALGESLGELAEHVESCASCRGLVGTSRQLGAVHHAVDPGLGFTARMTVGAQHRLAVRRRRRVALGLAATVATGALGVFVVTHSEEPQPAAIQLPARPRPSEPPAAADDADLAALVQLADVDHASRVSARWSEIKKPLAPYRKLLQGVTP